MAPTRRLVELRARDKGLRDAADTAPDLGRYARRVLSEIQEELTRRQPKAPAA